MNQVIAKRTEVNNKRAAEFVPYSNNTSWIPSARHLISAKKKSDERRVHNDYNIRRLFLTLYFMLTLLILFDLLGIWNMPNQQGSISSADQRIIRNIGFEGNEPRAWEIEEGFTFQGSGAYFLTTPLAHSGKYSLGLSINTQEQTATGSHAAYFFYPFPLDEDAYYYSAWYYLPGGVICGDWWNIWQWKSTYNGRSIDSKPIFVVGILQGEGTNFLYLRDILNPVINDQLLQETTAVPTDRWFQIEAYYRKANHHSGELIIWQDGYELFHLTDTVTSLSDNTIFWSVNNYTDTITPNPYAIYVDDIAVSRERLGPG